MYVSVINRDSDAVTELQEIQFGTMYHGFLIIIVIRSQSRYFLCRRLTFEAYYVFPLYLNDWFCYS